MGNYAENVRRRIIQFQLVMFLWPSSLLVRGGLFDRQTLDSFVVQHALKNSSNSNRRTGRLYDVVLPANFSGMEASVVRFRSGSLWKRGANFRLFHIPPNILPVPFMRRMHIVFVNLGNWSSSYYNVSNHSLVAPVVGLLGYDADMANSSTHRRIEFRLMKDPILVHFPNNNNISRSLASMKCVRFGIYGGTVEFSNVTVDGLCVARGQGHFTLVIPTPNPNPNPPSEEKKRGKWWAVGFGVGVMGLIFVGIMMYRVVKQKRVGRMQKQSEKSEALDTVWVGRSRMPCATTIRTQPLFEDNYVP